MRPKAIMPLAIMPLFPENFLPKPSDSKTSGGFLNPTDLEDGGKVRFVLLDGDLFPYYMFWVTEAGNTNRKKPVRCIEDPTPEDIEVLIDKCGEHYGNEFVRALTRDGKGPDPVKKASCLWVYDLTDSKTKLLDMTQITVMAQLDAISQMEEYDGEEIFTTDLVLTRFGMGTDTKYTLIPTGKRLKGSEEAVAQAKEEIKAYKKEAIITWGNPYSSDG